jgi:citrate lyase beta subunit
LTDTDAYFNYLEHQSEQRHNKTVAQRVQDYDRVLSAARRSMTPEKIKRLRLQKMETMEAVRALRQVKRDEERREEEERLQKKLIETAGARKQAQILWRKHFDLRHVVWEKRGSTVEN